MEDQERMELKILGKVIGTYAGWDQANAAVFIFYNVQLNELGQKAFPQWENNKHQNLTIAYDQGLAEATWEEGEESAEKLISVHWRHFE